MERPPVDGNYFGITDSEDQSWLMARLAPHSPAAFQPPAEFGGASHLIARRTFIACQWALETYGPKPSQAGEMHYVELPTAHDVMITAPRELADILLDLS